MQHWAYLAVAIGLEVCGTLSMKLSDGFHRLNWAAAMIIFYLLSFGCVAMAVKTIPISTAYAIWSGLGTAMIAVVGILHFRESHEPLKLISIALIVVGVIGLNLFGDPHSPPPAPPEDTGANRTQTGAGTL